MAVSRSLLSASTSARSDVPDVRVDQPDPFVSLFLAPWSDWAQWPAFSTLLDGEKNGRMVRHWTLIWQDHWRRQFRLLGLLG